MPETHHLPIVLILLSTAVVIVALFQRMRVSPVLGYLVAGVLIGPGGMGLISDANSMDSLADAGIMFLLFIIGLELSWERLHAMRLQSFGVGIAQVVVTTGVIALILHFAGIATDTAVIIGGALALSSTALVLQLIAEHNQKASQLGRLSLAVLLVQDLAVVPLLALVPAMATGSGSVSTALIAVGIKAAVALGLIFFAGRLLLRPIYRLIASQGNPEIFTALTLLIVLGTGWLTSSAGLSPAFGAFMAGLLMAETEYRHQVEADVMPYKGLFLGLFFMTVGMSVDPIAVWQQLTLVFSLAMALMAIKALIILGLSRALRFNAVVSIQAALLMAQGGEFAFVVFELAGKHAFLTPELSQLLTIVVALSMAMTPLLAFGGRRVTRSIQHRQRSKAEESVAEMTDMRDHVIILGFGRVGQTIAKLLSAEGIHYIALDMEIKTVSRARKIGLPVYYGNGSQRDVLHAIGVERAAAAIVTVNEPLAAESSVRALRAMMPALPIIARGHDLKRVTMLEAAGANIAISEMFEASLQMGGALLKSMGIKDPEIVRIVQIFRDHDYALARGTLEASPGDETALGRMLAFQKAEIKGALVDDGQNDFSV